MSKILITSIGTGQYEKETNENSYQRSRYVEYKDGGQKPEQAESPYLLSFLIPVYGVSRVVLIGTAGSNWAALYHYMTYKQDKTNPDGIPEEKKNQGWFSPEVRDEALWRSLKSLSDDGDPAEQDPEKVERILEPMAKLFSKKTEFCILNYGRDEAEMLKNLARLEKLGGQFEEGDEIVFDITHSFRSLPFYELIALNYCRDILGKNVTVTNVSYGMFEDKVYKEKHGGCTPVVDLKPLTEMLDYMKAQSEYEHFGTVYQLLNLIDQKGKTALFSTEKEERKALKLLNEIAVGGIPDNFLKNLEKCHAFAERIGQESKERHSLRILLEKVMKDVDSRFYAVREDRFLLSCAVAEWHIAHKRGQMAALLVSTAYQEECALLCEQDIREYEMYEKFCKAIAGAGKQIRKEDGSAGELMDQYMKLRPLRNDFAHPTDQEKMKKDREQLAEIIRIMRTRYEEMLSSPEQRSRLRKAIEMNLN